LRANRLLIGKYKKKILCHEAVGGVTTAPAAWTKGRAASTKG